MTRRTKGWDAGLVAIGFALAGCGSGSSSAGDAATGSDGGPPGGGACQLTYQGGNIGSNKTCNSQGACWIDGQSAGTVSVAFQGKTFSTDCWGYLWGTVAGGSSGSTIDVSANSTPIQMFAPDDTLRLQLDTSSAVCMGTWGTGKTVPLNSICISLTGALRDGNDGYEMDAGDGTGAQGSITFTHWPSSPTDSIAFSFSSDATVAMSMTGTIIGSLGQAPISGTVTAIAPLPTH